MTGYRYSYFELPSGGHLSKKSLRFEVFVRRIRKGRIAVESYKYNLYVPTSKIKDNLVQYGCLYGLLRQIVIDERSKGSKHRSLRAEFAGVAYHLRRGPSEPACCDDLIPAESA